MRIEREGKTFDLTDTELKKAYREYLEKICLQEIDAAGPEADDLAFYINRDDVIEDAAYYMASNIDKRGMSREQAKDKAIERSLHDREVVDFKVLVEELSKAGILVVSDNEMGGGALQIQRDDSKMLFAFDHEAAEVAETRFGVPIIRDLKFNVEDLADYIDTPANRAILADYAVGQVVEHGGISASVSNVDVVEFYQESSFAATVDYAADAGLISKERADYILEHCMYAPYSDEPDYRVAHPDAICGFFNEIGIFEDDFREISQRYEAEKYGCGIDGMAISAACGGGQINEAVREKSDVELEQ